MSEPLPLPPWGSAVAGASGAVLANALLYPLDIVKTRLQVQIKHKNPEAQPVNIDHHHHHHHYESTIHAIQKIIEHEGLHGLYSGLGGALIGVASSNFAYFYWYSVVRTLYMKSQNLPGQHPSTAVELSLGAIAGALGQLFTIPISVITTRQQTQPKSDKRGMLDTAKEIVHSEDGWTGLWRGFKASLVLVVNPSITYGAYQRLREILFHEEKILRPWEAFLLGAMSKSLATVLTQPLIVAKVGLQSRPPPARQGKPFKSFHEVMGYIIEHEGYIGLFKGIGPQVLKGLLVQGILMMTKERVELLFVLLFAYIRTVRQQQLKKAADALKSSTQPLANKVVEQAKAITIVTK